MELSEKLVIAEEMFRLTSREYLESKICVWLKHQVYGYAGENRSAREKSLFVEFSAKYNLALAILAEKIEKGD
jgi:hypothetical protein